ncbi:MAG: AtpZ/AtpI family protein [Pseudomonadota bacterium]
MSKGAREAFRILAVASTMGISMVLATVIGLGIGFFLDRYFGTSPWLTLIFLVLGIIAGFNNLYVIMKKVQRMEDEADDKRAR